MIQKESPSESQKAKILSWLQSGYSITPMVALKKFNCFRLGARVKNLRDKGYEIITDMIEDKKTNKRYASYRLSGVEPKSEKSMPGKTVADFSKAINQVKQSIKTRDELF